MVMAMGDGDKQAFASALNTAMSLYGAGQMSREALQFWWALMSPRMSIDTFQSALHAPCVDPDRGRYAPKPADITAAVETAIERSDGRPGSDEAWSIALRVMDDAESVVWTTEIAAAWGVALDIYEAGDKVGARMAFRERYERDVSAARQRGEKAQWSMTLGTDRSRREQVAREAVSAGLLPASYSAHLLPAPVTDDGMAIAGLLTGDTSHDAKASEHVRRHLAAIRKVIASSGKPAPIGDRKRQDEKASEEERRRELDRQVRQWQQARESEEVPV